MNLIIIAAVVSSRILEPVGLSMLASSRPFKHSQSSVTTAMRNTANPATSGNRFGMKTGSLSSTLEKLYVWEQKLYKEVKVHLILLGISLIACPHTL